MSKLLDICGFSYFGVYLGVPWSLGSVKKRQMGTCHLLTCATVGTVTPTKPEQRWQLNFHEDPVITQSISMFMASQRPHGELCVWLIMFNYQLLLGSHPFWTPCRNTAEPSPPAVWTEVAHGCVQLLWLLFVWKLQSKNVVLSSRKHKTLNVLSSWFT